MESHPQPTSREPGSSGSEVTEKGEPVLEVSGGISVDLVYGRRHEHMQDLENAGTGAQDLQLAAPDRRHPPSQFKRSESCDTGWPCTPTIQSPARSPAPAAAEPATTSCTRASPLLPASRARGPAPRRAQCPADTPRLARRTRPWRISSMATHCAVLMATANARPCAEGIAAVFTPITRPALSSSGPPELPGLSAASV